MMKSTNPSTRFDKNALIRVTGLLEAGLGGGAVVVLGDHSGDEDDLFPAEVELLGGAGSGRRRTFLGGRLCAHRALERLRGQAAPVGRGERGEPVWPAGIAGSITHGEQLAGALVVPAWAWEGVGIDLEETGRLKCPGPVLARILCPGELEEASRLPYPAEAWFAAKESCFKALANLGEPPPGIREIRVCFLTGGHFRATWDKGGGEIHLMGILVEEAGHVFTVAGHRG